MPTASRFHHHQPLAAPFAWLLAAGLWLMSLAPATAAVRVLYLGDSFSKGAFGRNLDAQMRAAGLEVYTSVTGGASAYDWLPEFGATSTTIGYWEKTPKKEFRVTHLSRIPKIDEMVERWQPNVVVIQGGTNMYSVLTSKRRPKDQNVAELERLLNRIGHIVTSSGAQLYWITPATAHPNRFSPALQAEMREILFRVGQRYGRTFDSYSVTRFKDPYPGTDGIHYGPTDAAAWSRLVAKDLIDYSARLGTGKTRRQWLASRSASREPATSIASAANQDNRPPAAHAAAASAASAAASASAGKSARGRGIWDIFRRKRTTDPAAAGDVDGIPSAPKATPATARPAATTTTLVARPASPPLQVDVVLRQKSAIANLGEVTYRSALGVFDYEVVSVIRGNYTAKTMRIAHLIVMNNQYTSINQRPLGSRMTLDVEPLSRYPNLEKIQTVDDLEPAYDLDVFVPKL